MYTHLITKQGATAIFDDGTTKHVAPGTPRYDQVVQALEEKAPEEQVKTMMDGETYIAYWSCGEFDISKNNVTWKARPEYEIPKPLVKALMDYAAEGYSADSFCKFLTKLLRNPSSRSVDTFFGFCEQQGLTIDRDGYVMGYKGVQDNLTDCHTGKFDNSPGQEHRMERNHVDDNPNSACSRGFHFGGWDYAHNFGSRMVLVRVDPVDLVCVPHDCSQGKVRTCAYTVVKEVAQQTQMKPFYGNAEELGETSPSEYVDNTGPEWNQECMDCGTMNHEDDDYCRGCGSDLEITSKPKDEPPAAQASIECDECGWESEPGADLAKLNHCPYCGELL